MTSTRPEFKLFRPSTILSISFLQQPFSKEGIFEVLFPDTPESFFHPNLCIITYFVKRGMMGGTLARKGGEQENDLSMNNAV